jgi:predicted membrane channel-forming protein YqfA (hemolysin III family)
MLPIFIFLLMGIFIFIYVIAISFIMWMAIDAGKNDKFWWIVLIIGLPLVGAILYYFTEKKHDYAKIPEVKNSSKEA